jgi:ATP-dependent Clp protease ATP-binding subunit ClpC
VIGTEHLLLGLYAEPDGVAAKVLLGMQITGEQVEAALREHDEPAGQADSVDAPAAGKDRPGTPSAPGAGSADAATGHRPMSPRARNALVNALAVALELGHNYIGTEHLLLGLYRDPDGLASRLLTEVGAERAEVEARVAELLRGYAKP